jgi:hypothetical protein
MMIRDFFHGIGTIAFKDKFVSLRLVREALERKFTIRILEETPTGLRCKITRFTRLYAAPVPFPNPTLAVTFHNGPDGTTVNYKVTSYDYYMLAIGFLLTTILSVIYWPADHAFHSIKDEPVFMSVTLIFFVMLIILDTKFLVYRIRKALSKVY